MHNHPDNATSDLSLLLASALSREVKIYSTSIAIGVSSTTFIEPYNLLLTQAFIADKLANFNGLRAGIKLSIRVNATPFHYGAAFLSYLPLHKFKRNGYIDATEDETTKVQLSSTPNFVMLPLSGSSAVEMEIPYIYPRDFIALKGEFSDPTTRQTPSTTFNHVGSLAIQIASPLRNASTSTDPITLYVTASLIDPHLSLPTTQSGKEASLGPISSVASSVANFAQYGESFKALKPFARATGDIASHLGGIARIFGFSRPVVLDPPKPMRPEWFGAMANTDQNEVVQNLSVDSQCELSVTPDSVRLDLDDELNIAAMCQRSAYIGTMNIPMPTRVSDGLNYWLPVTPSQVRPTAGLPLRLALTPSAMVSRMFSKWRGTVVFTLKAVKSGVHTGRLQIRHDALESFAGTSSSISEVKTTFWNLGDSDELEICVPWLQGSEFLPFTHEFGGHGGVKTQQPTPHAQVNGNLQISVVSDIVCSTSTTSPIEILVFARMDSAEFMAPSNNTSTLCSTPATQSGCEPSSQDMTGCNNQSNACVYGGEKVVSLRALIKRYTLSFVDFIDGPGSKQIQIYRFPRFPIDPGFTADFSGHHEVAPGTKNVNFGTFSNAGWISRCFAMARGSMRYKLQVQGATHVVLAAKRASLYRPALTFAQTLSAVSPSSFSFAVQNKIQGGAAGMDSMVNGFSQGEFSVPDYNHNYSRITNLDNVRGTMVDGSATDYFEIDIAKTNSNDSNCAMYVAAGSDFSPFYFVCVPLVEDYQTLIPY